MPLNDWQRQLYLDQVSDDLIGELPPDLELGLSILDLATTKFRALAAKDFADYRLREPLPEDFPGLENSLSSKADN
jgi:hypothetical protein